MTEPEFVPYADRYDPKLPPEAAACAFYECMRKRRSVREFSERPVSRETIEWIVRTAASAPSGANKQPWRFVCVNDSRLKHEIRMGAEEEERTFYGKRASQQWLQDLSPLGTDANKPFLEIAPWLIVVFKLTQNDDGSPAYYVNESVGIAVGMLLAAAHCAGLATLTHTPSPMKFLGNILGRPDNEKPFVLVPVGYPADNCRIPKAAIERKPVDEVLVMA